MKNSTRHFLLFFSILIIIIMGSCSTGIHDATMDEFAPDDGMSDSPPQSPFSIVTLGYSEEIPETFHSLISLPDGWKISEKFAESDLNLVAAQSGQPSTAQWIFALVAPFNTLQDEVQSSELINFWLGKSDEEFPANTILVSSSAYNSLAAQWGAPSTHIKTLASEDILSQAWLEDGNWAIIPFEELQPKWKVITVDGQNPVEKGFSPDSYPLSISYTLACSREIEQSQCSALSQQFSSDNPNLTNRDPEKMTTVLLTGVTALVRGTALLMERNSMTYPAEKIIPILQDADILHISNEIPFAEKCPFPFPRSKELVFCSRPQYMELLDVIGTDVVELSGDHFKDWGPDAMYYTLQIYNDRDLPYYGGGKDLDDARKPLTLENNGNRIAFIGCNAKPLGYSSASASTPGAVHCNFEWMTKEISRLKKEGYITIATFQHLEYYAYEAKPELKLDFHNVANAGADIVSGSQAHQPHAIEFYNNAFLHYGLGNLFFDQYYEGEAVRDAFLDRHVIYDGRHISTQLLTIKAVDLAQVRLMTTDERNQLLTTIFKASGWTK